MFLRTLHRHCAEAPAHQSANFSERQTGRLAEHLARRSHSAVLSRDELSRELLPDEPTQLRVDLPPSSEQRVRCDIRSHIR